MKYTPVVVLTDFMDDETFKMHFTLRHMDRMPGLDSFVDPAHPDTIRSYRIFHDTIHRLLPMEEEHTHEDC